MDLWTFPSPLLGLFWSHTAIWGSPESPWTEVVADDYQKKNRYKNRYSKADSAPSYALKNWLFWGSVHNSVDLRIEIGGPELAEAVTALKG